MRYCAYLRGVNVNGTTMKMADVCAVFANVGVQKVTSVLASGNIIFSSEEEVAVLKETLQKAMSAHFNYDAFLFIKSEKEIEEILKSNPFPKDENFHTYAFIGNDGVHKILAAEFEKASKAENEEGKIAAQTFYWQISKGSTLSSEFGKILGRKSLKDQISSRNINTFEKIIKKL